MAVEDQAANAHRSPPNNANPLCAVSDSSLVVIQPERATYRENDTVSQVVRLVITTPTSSPP